METTRWKPPATIITRRSHGKASTKGATPTKEAPAKPHKTKTNKQEQTKTNQQRPTTTPNKSYINIPHHSQSKTSLKQPTEAKKPPRRYQPQQHHMLTQLATENPQNPH
ncbi:hypothetical protein KFK09_018648 [Dendrobium nobile]|uniref:Uncharacterized protein n=1 Tax=Dendrobium nobile TaxID=94219 RepID=A0A8T3AUY4_DENNO|nr:hypothetical protein KFK09_018648 [Dendrobium nobile]